MENQLKGHIGCVGVPGVAKNTKSSRHDHTLKPPNRIGWKSEPTVTKLFGFHARKLSTRMRMRMNPSQCGPETGRHPILPLCPFCGAPSKIGHRRDVASLPNRIFPRLRSFVLQIHRFILAVVARVTQVKRGKYLTHEHVRKLAALIEE
jgi:hypothetical protein